jgi:K+-sensing histidine kinase KdpD
MMPLSPDSQLLKDLLHLLLSDIRSPITDLLTNLPPMQAQADAEAYEPLMAVSEFTLRYSERLLSVIDMLLDVMREGVVKLITDNLALQVVAEQALQAVSERAQAQGVTIYNHITSDLPKAVLDERLFTQAFINLIELMLMQNPNGGDIHLTADYHDTPSHFDLKLYDQRTVIDFATFSAPFQAPLSTLLSRRDSLRIILSRVVMRAHGAKMHVLPLGEGKVVFEVLLPLVSADPSVKRFAAARLFSDDPLDDFGVTHD